MISLWSVELTLLYYLALRFDKTCFIEQEYVAFEIACSLLAQRGLVMMDSSLEAAIYAAKRGLSQSIQGCAVQQLSSISTTLSGHANKGAPNVDGFMCARAIADLVVEYDPEQLSSLMLQFQAQIGQRQAQRHLVPLCCKHWPVTLGGSFESLREEFEGDGNYLDPSVNPENFGFSLSPSDCRTPLSLLTLVKQEPISGIIEMVNHSSFGLPDLAHALLFGIRYSHVLTQAKVVVPCRPWECPRFGPCALLIDKKVLTGVHLDAIPLVGSILVLVVGENRVALAGSQIWG